MKRWVLVTGLLVTLLAPALRADEITVAAASDLQFALRDVAQRFEQATGHRVKLAFGSSGNFYAQIQNGAPFDVFLSADILYPRKLIESGKAERDSLFVYGVGRIVLWVPKDSRLNVEQGLKTLLDPGVRKIALANPAHAPYGRAAVAALQHAGVYDQVSNKFVLGENISQTMHFVESGNVDAGMVALSLASAPASRGKGKYWVVPADYHPAIEQAAAVISASAHQAAAQAFLDFLRKPETVELMKSYGFEPPPKKK